MNFESLISTKKDKLKHLKELLCIPSIHPRKYTDQESFEMLDFISHPKFGSGIVEKIIDRKKMKVFFKSGSMVLSQRQFCN